MSHAACVEIVRRLASAERPVIYGRRRGAARRRREEFRAWRSGSGSRW